MSATALYASTSRTAPSTPIRAITSTIASRSTPALPPASEAYEPLVKSFFRHRLKYVLVLSALSSWAVQSTWAWWAVDGASGGDGLFGKTWARVALAFSPSLLVVFLTPRRLGTTSPQSTIKTALAQNSTRIAFATYLASATAALVVHVIMAYAYESSARGDPKLSVFVKSKKHPHYLNGRLVFLLVSQFVTSIAFTLRGAMTDRFSYRWTYAISKTTPRSLVLTVSLFISLINTLLSLLASAIFFALLRLCLPVLYKLPLIPHLLRPFTAHFLRGQWTVLLPLGNLGLVFRAGCLAYSTFLVWELSDVFFEHVVSEVWLTFLDSSHFSVLMTVDHFTQPTPVSAFSPDPNTTVVSGTTSVDRIYKFFAYSELLELASSTIPSSASRRSSLFGDQKSSSLNLWGTLARESLLLLGEDYQLLLRRGKPPLPPVAPVVPAKPKVLPNPSPEVAKPATLLRQRVWKGDAGAYVSGTQSPGEAALDALAADGPLVKAAEAGMDRFSHQVPELFRSVSHAKSPTKDEHAVTKQMEKKNDNAPLGVGDVTSALKNVLNIQKHVDAFKSKTHNALAERARKVWSRYGREEVGDRVVRFLQWWSEERVSRVVEGAVAYRELDVLVIDVLSHLVCASLQEDTYGTVQRDIPKILEAFTSFLIAIEEYQVELNGLLKPLPTDPEALAKMSAKERYERNALEVEVWRAGEVLGFVGDGEDHFSYSLFSASADGTYLRLAGLKEAIARIVRTFGDKLLAFKFPPRVAGKLQGFVDYSVPVQ
ncbi:hypothetical protein CVT26_013557 [Gymnopilus dilepis]|uniref:Nucleoporin protein Ndc1-Nup n=1 Tax=Gymnopilus dilepis TaxID=231916 RepID=A0A409YX41_9AGAR|nr:hypothetical protein CVT26_013557 [Gymnopilus dilepis]